jgi:hypothetical protein
MMHSTRIANVPTFNNASITVPTNTHCPSLIDPFRPRKIPDGWMVVPIPVCEAGEERRGG